MTTMRERLVEAAEKAAEYGPDKFHEAQVENWPDIIDAILAALREPDEAMLKAAEAVDLLGDNEPNSAGEFTAMIDAIRAAK